jgi:hypothetical protein
MLFNPERPCFSHNPIHGCYINPDPICEMKKFFNYARLSL